LIGSAEDPGCRGCLDEESSEDVLINCFFSRAYVLSGTAQRHKELVLQQAGGLFKGHWAAVAPITATRNGPI